MIQLDYINIIGTPKHVASIRINSAIAAKSLLKNMPENEKSLLFQKQSNMITKAKDYINNYLNPSKINVVDPS